MVEGLVEAVVLVGDPVADGALRRLGCRQDRGQVEARRLPVVDGRRGVEQVDPADGLLDASAGRARPGTRAPPRRCTRRRSRRTRACPVKRLRSTGFWVAIPTGQVSRWQTRIMMQPDTTSGAVAKPNSSAPSSAPMTTSRPVFICPSTWTTIRSRRSLAIRVCWVSARPSSQGIPACFMRGERGGAGAAVVARDEHDVGLGLGHPGRHRARPRPRPPASRGPGPSGWPTSGRG